MSKTVGLPVPTSSLGPLSESPATAAVSLPFDQLPSRPSSRHTARMTVECDEAGASTADVYTSALSKGSCISDSSFSAENMNGDRVLSRIEGWVYLLDEGPNTCPIKDSYSTRAWRRRYVVVEPHQGRIGIAPTREAMLYDTRASSLFSDVNQPVLFLGKASQSEGDELSFAQQAEVEESRKRIFRPRSAQSKKAACDEGLTMIDIRNCDFYAVHRSIFRYDPQLQHVFAIEFANTRYLCRVNDYWSQIKWVAGCKRFQAAPQHGGIVMFRELLIELKDLTWTRPLTRSSNKPVELSVVVHIRGFPHAMTPPRQSTTSSLSLDDGLVLDWMRISRRHLQSAITARVVRCNKKDKETIAEATLPFGLASNYARASKKVQMKGNKPIILSASLEPKIVIMYPLQLAEPVLHWFDQHGDTYYESIVDILSKSFGQIRNIRHRHEPLLRFLRGFLAVFVNRGDLVERWLVKLLRQFFERETQTKDGIDSAGRRNEPVTMLLHAYVFYFAQNWLLATLGDSILSVQHTAEELGMCNVAGFSCREQHVERLKQHFSDIWGRIVAAADQFPHRVRTFCVLLTTALRQDFPVQIDRQITSVLIFQFLCTAISAPHTSGLTQTMPDSAQSTWLKHLAGAIKSMFYGMMHVGNPFEQFVKEQYDEHHGNASRILTMWRTPSLEVMEGVSTSTATCDRTLMRRSLAVFMYDLQNLRMTLQARFPDKPAFDNLVELLQPVTNFTIAVANAQDGSEDGCEALDASTSGSELGLAMYTAQDIRAAFDSVPLSIAEASSTEDVNETASFGYEDAVTAPTVPVHKHLQLRQRAEALASTYRALRAVAYSSVCYVEQLTGFIQEQGLVPPLAKLRRSDGNVWLHDDFLQFCDSDSDPRNSIASGNTSDCQAESPRPGPTSLSVIRGLHRSNTGGTATLRRIVVSQPSDEPNVTPSVRRQPEFVARLAVAPPRRRVISDGAASMHSLASTLRDNSRSSSSGTTATQMDRDTSATQSPQVLTPHGSNSALHAEKDAIARRSSNSRPLGASRPGSGSASPPNLQKQTALKHETYI